jgi:flavin-dependent dehydrogenase
MARRIEPVHIVGAGLAGLTAAIILAKEGREVIVYEKGKRVGGLPLYNPSPHGTPMDVEEMNRYLGFDLRPGLVPLPEGCFCVWGKRYRFVFPPNTPSYMIERGPRHSSMDHYLFQLAREAGVRFEFGHPVITKEEVRSFPRGTIFATGLHIDGFEITGVPCRLLRGYFAKCRVPWTEARVTVYFDDYTPDYAFTCSVNGIGFALIFNRYRPVAPWEWDKFIHQATAIDGYPFKRWLPLECALPIRRLSSPRLFQEGLILAGTLAGIIDPILFFGMHGAFLSGKIAAMAVTDPYRASMEFRRLNCHFKPVLAAKSVIDHLPREVFIKYPVRLVMNLWPLHSRFLVRQLFKINISGYGRYRC